MAGQRGSANSVAATALVMMVSVTMLVDVAQAATTYTVGGSGGWTFNVNSWTNGKKFKVGDTLEFKFDNKHDLMEVNKNDYDNCQPNPTGIGRKSTSTKVTLDALGTRYFICTKPGHCVGGMKIAVTTSN